MKAFYQCWQTYRLSLCFLSQAPTFYTRMLFVSGWPLLARDLFNVTKLGIPDCVSSTKTFYKSSGLKFQPEQAEVRQAP
ncbi:hypothetical protein BTA51_15890 [Hahella sp. CCB-MM4]|nr:hypothetical protein BTA51_15890 [Hahella sp. CCB-MM4]